TTLRINGMEYNTTTDDAGYFRFESLEPRDYIITAQKEGYRPKSQRAIIEDDKIFQLDFILEEVPRDLPYNTTVPFNGRISCQFAYQTTPDNTQRPKCIPADVDPTNDPDQLFDVLPGAAQVLVEVVWTQGSAAAHELTVTVESLGDNGVQFAYESGESTLRTVVSQSLIKQNMRDGGKLRVLVEAAPSLTGDEAATDAGLAFQQPFTIYFTTFYIEPGPVNYSAAPKN
ncbi:MAG TPA: carboxypeptidase-like regulatory domain-containing protein, partial [Candidatus Thermoplasmatota archaeon]|nr:carboxypeptidase-like regulatory domain-containing protein [Candidatus Thermoplasmatota archaeon]